MNRFEDFRGTIEDWFDGEPAHITWIFTRKGKVRGNHFHSLTHQCTILMRGRLLIAAGGVQRELAPGQFVDHPPGEPHAWRALEDSECLVLTLGPRGEDYESDTVKLDEPLL